MKKKSIPGRLWLLLFAPAAFAFNGAAAKYPAFAEWYAVTLYPFLSRGVNFLTSLLPFSLAEGIVVLLIPAALVSLVHYLIKRRREKEARRKHTARFLLTPLCAASALYFIFVLSCGINYNRYPFARTSGLEARPSSAEELTALCSGLADRLNTLRGKVRTDDRSVMKLSDPDIRRTAKRAQAAYDRIGAKYPLLRPGYGPPKPVVLSRLMSYCGITGIFFPFTFEANVNVDPPDYSIPVTMCHELSHLRGFMREDEANFAGYLVCEYSGNTDFEYSGNMLAFIHASNALSTADPKAAETVFSNLSQGVRRDLADSNAYWKQFEGTVSQASDRVNDSYLKANNQEEGIKSYGRMVDLLLAEFREKKESR